MIPEANNVHGNRSGNALFNVNEHDNTTLETTIMN